MVTRFCIGTNRHTERLNLHVSSISPLPKSYRYAFSDPNWQNSMCDEYHALIKNKTCTLVHRPLDTNIVRCMWLFRHKYLVDGTLSRYKARLVANGSTQLKGVDVDETFSPVVKPGTDTAYLLLYVDDIVLAASSEDLVMRDWMFLSRKKYVVEILERAHMVNCNPSRTPIDTESKLGSDGDVVFDPTLYWSHAGSLQYFISTRPYISYAIWLHILMQIGLVSPLHNDRLPATVNNLLSWSSKHQSTLSCSSAEEEYRGVANAVAKTCWLRNLLRELHTLLSSATFVYCDNVSDAYLSCNPVQHQRTKHIEIDIHFVRDLVAAGQVRVLHVSSRYQVADIFPMGFPSALFEEFRSSLSVQRPPAPTVGEC
ncbi:ribonuclease H-like domain-containing protein [Tanacetum coccineum]